MRHARKFRWAAGVAAVAAAGAVGFVAIGPSGAANGPGRCSYPNSNATRFGSSLHGSAAAGTTAAWQSTGHSLCTTRVYLGTIGHGKTWAKTGTLSKLPVNSRVVLSYRSGAAADITAFLKTRPADTQCWVSFWHEPENSFKGSAATARYRADWAAQSPAIRAAGCKATLILQGYSATDQGPRWQDYYNASAVDAIAWDLWSGGWRQNPPSYTSPALMLNAPQRVAIATGKPWGLAEAGSPVIRTDPSQTARCTWANIYHADTLKTSARFAIWDDWIQHFSNGTALNNDATSCIRKVWMAGGPTLKH